MIINCACIFQRRPYTGSIKVSKSEVDKFRSLWTCEFHFHFFFFIYIYLFAAHIENKNDNNRH